MAHAAAGGVGFGAGEFSVAAAIDMDLRWPVRCCDRWRFGERNLLSYSSWTLLRNRYHVELPSHPRHRRRSSHRLRTLLACAALRSPPVHTYCAAPRHPSPHISISPSSSATMPFLESMQDGLDRILPRKKRNPIVSKSISGGIGSTAGIVRYQDDVRFFPARFLVSLFLLLPRWSSQRILISTSFRYVILPCLLLCRCLYGPVWHAGLSPLRPPAMGHMACGCFLYYIPSFTALLTRCTRDSR